MPMIAPYTRLLALSRTAYIRPYTPPAMKNPLAAHGSAMRAAVSAGPNEPIGKLYAAHSTVVQAATILSVQDSGPSSIGADCAFITDVRTTALIASTAKPMNAIAA